MEQETAISGTAEPAALTLLARQADGVLFDTLGVDEFDDLEFFADDDTGALVATASEAETYVRLEADESGLNATENTDINPDDLDEIEITEPQPTTDVDGDQIRRRGD